MFKKVIGIVSAMALGFLPVAASAATANPASALSVSKSVRSGTTTTGKNRAAGGGVILGALIAAGVIGIVVVAAVNGDDNSDSN